MKRIRRAFTVAAQFLLIAVLASGCVCLGGGVCGNPTNDLAGPAPESIGLDPKGTAAQTATGTISNAICDRYVQCVGDSVGPVCRQSITTIEIGTGFGLEASETLESIDGVVGSDNSKVDFAQLQVCKEAIEETSCSDPVFSSFDLNDPSPNFSTASSLVPEGECLGVFDLNGSSNE